MSSSRLALTISISATMALGAGAACGQAYPNKPIRFISAGAGSGGDFVSRLVARALTASFGRQVIVENHPSGVIVGDLTAKAAPDGYSIMVYGSSVWNISLVQKAPYDPLKDFAPVGIVGSSPNVVLAHPTLPVKSIKDLIALAKAKPGVLNYGSTGTGSSNHLAALLFKSMARIDIVHVPYKDGATLTSDLVSGQVHMTFANTSFAVPLMKSGRMRGIAVTSLKPTPLVPGLPTVADTGLPGYSSGALYVMFAPAKTPADIINRLSQETARGVKQPEIMDALLKAGVEPVGSTPEELGATMKLEITRMGQLIKDAGLRTD